MATFITLLRYTQQGIKDIKGSPGRLDNARKAAQGMNSSIKGFYLTLGRYDAVAIIEAPDDEAAARFALATGSQGNVTTETLRAFNEEEFRKLIASLP